MTSVYLSDLTPWPGISSVYSPAHCPDFGPDAVLGRPALLGAGEFPTHDSGPPMWLPATIVGAVLFCRTSGPPTVVPSITT